MKNFSPELKIVDQTEVSLAQDEANKLKVVALENQSNNFIQYEHEPTAEEYDKALKDLESIIDAASDSPETFWGIFNKGAMKVANLYAILPNSIIALADAYIMSDPTKAKIHGKKHEPFYIGVKTAVNKVIEKFKKDNKNFNKGYKKELERIQKKADLLAKEE